MAKHTIGFAREDDSPATEEEVSEYKAEALDILRERGDLPEDVRYIVEDGTTEAHRNNPDGPELVIVVRTDEPGY